MLITDKEKLTQFHTCHRVWQGIPGIARTKKGRTFISFYSGETSETYGNYVVLLKSDADNDFGEPIVAVKKEGKFRCFDPVLWLDPLDRLWLIWNVMPGEEVHASICSDPDAPELVWSEAFYIGRGVMINKPTVLTSREWLFPIALWQPNLLGNFRKSALKPDDQPGSYVYKTSDNGKNFIRLGMANIRNRSFDEHMIIELESSVLMMLVRTNYGIGISYSYDRGNNWSKGEDSHLGGPCSRFHICRLRSGRILLINHHNYTDRDNLTALLSEDDGKTFPYSLLLDERADVSYPDATESDDGYIYITYDRQRGCFKKSLAEAYACAREVLTAKITEEDIINGSLTSKNSFLKNVVSKLDRLAPEDADPYPEYDATTLEELVDYLLAQDCDILENVFTRYPINCTNITQVDIEKLDALVECFRKSGFKDRKMLTKIIALLRAMPRSTVMPDPIIQQVCLYIENNLTEDYPITSIAKDLNMSVYYLSHLFKSVTGTSPVAYRNELRLTRAKKLLVNTNETISQIASKCGFGSVSYFTEIFSRSEQISPSKFRRYHTGN